MSAWTRAAEGVDVRDTKEFNWWDLATDDMRVPERKRPSGRRRAESLTETGNSGRKKAFGRELVVHTKCAVSLWRPAAVSLGQAVGMLDRQTRGVRAREREWEFRKGERRPGACQRMAEPLL